MNHTWQWPHFEPFWARLKYLAWQPKNVHNWSHFQSCLERRLFSIKEHDTVNSDFPFSLFFLILLTAAAAKFCRKKCHRPSCISEEGCSLIRANNTCPSGVPFFSFYFVLATGQLSNVCYLTWRSLVIKTGLVLFSVILKIRLKFRI